MFRNHGSCLEIHVSSLWAAGFWYFCSMFLHVSRDLQSLQSASATPTASFPSIYLFMEHMVGGITQLTDVPLWCLQFVPCIQGPVVYKQRLVTLDKVIILAIFVLRVSSLRHEENPDPYIWQRPHFYILLIVDGLLRLFDLLAFYGPSAVLVWWVPWQSLSLISHNKVFMIPPLTRGDIFYISA